MTKINKTGWEKRQVGEVFGFIKNGANIKQNKDIVGYPVTRIETLSGGVFNPEKVGYAGITDLSKYGAYVLEDNDILMSHINSKAYIGRAVIYKNVYHSTFIHGMNLLRLREIAENVNAEYVCRYFQSQEFKANIAKIRKDAVNQSSFAIADLKKIEIPLPPLPLQQRIVDELDEINAIISAKKQQIKELDELAQSIFYNMFGDPVNNEKGWEVHKLGVVSPLINGRAYKQNELLDKGKYKVLRVGNFFTNGNYYYSDLELPEDKYCDNGDLLFAWSASFGARIWDGEKVIYHYHIWKVNYDTSLINKWFYLYLLNTLTSALVNDAHGIGMIHLTKGGMEEKQIPLPPLPLQETFATRVSAIEEEKAAITASIDEMQTLLNARMQEYFG